MPPQPPLTKSSLPARPNHEVVPGKEGGRRRRRRRRRPKDKKRGEEKFSSFSVLFFLHFLSQWENYPLYFFMGRTEEGNPLFRWGRGEGIRSGAPRRKSGNRGVTEAFFPSFSANAQSHSSHQRESSRAVQWSPMSILCVCGVRTEV